MNKVNSNKLNISFASSKTKENKCDKKPTGAAPKPVESSALELMSNINRPAVRNTKEEIKRIRAKELEELGVSSDCAEKYITLEEHQYQRAIDLIKNHKAKDSLVCQIIDMDDVQYERFKKLISKKLSIYKAIMVSEYSEEKYNRFLQLIESGEPLRIIEIAVNYSNEQYSTYLELRKQGVDSASCSGLISRGKQSYEQYENYVKNGIEPQVACILINQADWDTYSELEYSMAAKNLVNTNWETDEIKELYGFIGEVGEEKIQEVMNNEKLQALFSKGNVSKSLLKYILSLDEIQMRNFESSIEQFVPKIPNGANVGINKLQNGAGVEIFARKEVSSTDNPKQTSNNPDESLTVLRISTLNRKGQITNSVTEHSENGTVSTDHYFKSDKTIITNRKLEENKDHIISQIEIVNPRTGESPYIIYTKKSDLLRGAYETIKYDLSQYPEDLDVIKAIQKETLTGGEVLSEVKASDGVTRYKENYQQNGSNINRNYTRKTDENGNITSFEYSYNIVDKNGNTLLNMQRSWVKNSDETTTTTINGKEYSAFFNEAAMEITVKAEDGIVHTIKLDDIMQPYEEYSDSDNIKKSYSNDKELQKAFFDFCKTLSADQLISLSKHVKKVIITEDLPDSAYNDTSKELKTGFDYSTISHELGHAEDYITKSSDDAHIAKLNEDLIQTYNEEMEIFNLEHPYSEQKVIKYFSQTGGNYNTGLTEFIAETNMLMANYNHNNRFSTRAQYLVRYFPKTVAKIGQLLGY